MPVGKRREAAFRAVVSFAPPQEQTILNEQREPRMLFVDVDFKSIHALRRLAIDWYFF